MDLENASATPASPDGEVHQGKATKAAKKRELDQGMP
jgi:hypothetical protein